MQTLKRMALVVALAVLGTTLVDASPAMAFPLCTSWKQVTATDGTGQQVFVPATAGGDVSCTMYRGLSNQAVGILQKTLNYCYGKSLVVDNDFGPATEAALMDVQRLYGLDDDGWYGVFTRDKISHHPITKGELCGKYNGPGGS
ncbi:MAG: peptidoglycan-binding protein [Hamadaea sp.]|uniref:peptidoglycan-binding domain-containing protein n=1 Tax=Hamadaea sp. TaxID=2024425 RepID=UPI00181BD34E|nr:peptidoglycan-binding domain-containing protein [Hamadaea sp.]NUR70086.1 peptidoglycan-binding protein [Hamadaea sp.]NUT23422.1 peptidoglycan-binding protein [Hamadaea sp.]